MSEWQEVKLGGYCTKIGSGATPKGGKDAYLATGDFSLVRSQNVRNDAFTKNGLAYINEDQANKLSNVELKENDILLNITGDSVARCCLVDNSVLPARVNQHVAIIRPDEKEFDYRFLRYFLVSQKQQNLMLGLAASGATRNALTKGMIEGFSVPKPPLDVQETIGDVLSALDQKIELNQRVNETLEGMARSIFKSWFVDFDPVHAKAEGREPEGMDSTAAALFPSTFKDDGLPEGWEETKFEKCFDFTMGQSPPGDTYNEEQEGISFFQGRRDFGFRYPENRVYCTAPTRFAKAGDTLLSVRAPVGDLNMAIEDCCIGRGLSAIRHKSKGRSFTYYAMLNMQPMFDAYNSEGTVFGSVNKTSLGNLAWLEPSEEIVNAFERMAESVDQKIENNIKQNQILAALRDTLLPKLISGELRVDATTEKLKESVG